MIVRANDELTNVARGMILPEHDDVVSPVLSAWDGERLIKYPHRGGHDISSVLGSLAALIPDWLSDMLMTGTVLVMDVDDFYDLDEEVRKRMEILKR
jgi:hypothetical protein